MLLLRSHPHRRSKVGSSPSYGGRSQTDPAFIWISAPADPLTLSGSAHLSAAGPVIAAVVTLTRSVTLDA